MTQKTLTKPFNELTQQELERRKNFDCGEQSLNEYLTNRMRQHDEKNIAKSFLYVVDAEIVGYYTLSPTTIDFSETYPDIAKKNKFPKHPIPAILLARLAIDKQHQGKGYSDLLMAEIVTKAFVATKSVGGVGLVVDALHQKAAQYYEKYGFSISPVDPLKLFMSLKE